MSLERCQVCGKTNPDAEWGVRWSKTAPRLVLLPLLHPEGAIAIR